MPIHKGKTHAHFNGEHLGQVAKDHRFDIVTRICIYCNLSLRDYHMTKQPCKRAMDDAEEEE